MTQLNRVTLEYPKVLYHGTTTQYLEDLKENLIDPSKWNHARDFGGGFYTTADINQAKEWAIKRSQSKWGKFKPVVLVLSFNRLRYKGAINHQIFLGPNDAWADCVYEHRTRENPCRDCCDRHPVMIGPMARGLIEKAIVIREKYGRERFYYEIQKDAVQKKSLSVNELGDQLVFCNADLAKSTLRLAGYIVQEIDGRWGRIEKP